MPGRAFQCTATLLLATLVGLAGVRGVPSRACCDDDCAQPCCDRDADNASVVPVLPCCRTVTMHAAGAHATPSTLDDDDRIPVATPQAATAPVVVVALATAAHVARTHHLRAPPLYRQHCTLLL